MESLNPQIVIGVLVALAVVVIAFVLMQKRRTDELRGKFGPEYERLVQQHGDARHAESELASRVDRVKQLHIKPITPEHRNRFAEAWRSDQARFVDDPKGAVVEADRRIRCRLCAHGVLRLYMCGPRLRGRCRSCSTVYVFLWSHVRQGWYRWDGREN